MNKIFLSTIALGLCLLVASSCEETGGNPTGHPEGPTDDDAILYLVTPQASMRETWADHNLEVERVYYNKDVAVYFDSNVPESAKWPFLFMSKAWNYTKDQYGNFSKENRLYVVCHGGTYDGNFSGNHFDEATGYRSLSDVSGEPSDWSDTTNKVMDGHIQNMARIVESSSYSLKGSPASEIWGDNKWEEIFQYDVYSGLAMTDNANRIHDEYITKTEDFPRTNTYWFRDWFYPIYDEHGHGAVLVNFFKLLSENFPKDGDTYSRKMNMGEFIHFWSGAAGTDLKTLANTAFGTTDDWNNELAKAKKDFPSVTALY